MSMQIRTYIFDSVSSSRQATKPVKMAEMSTGVMHIGLMLTVVETFTIQNVSSDFTFLPTGNQKACVSAHVFRRLGSE